MSKQYPAYEFLHRFSDGEVRRQVAALFPEVDFGPRSADIVTPGSITELEIWTSSPRALAGLEVFHNLKSFRLIDDLPEKEAHHIPDVDWDWHVPAAWAQLETLTVTRGSMLGIYFPTEMPALKAVAIEGKEVTLAYPPGKKAWDKSTTYRQKSVEVLYLPQSMPLLQTLKLDRCQLEDLRLPADAPDLEILHITNNSRYTLSFAHLQIWTDRLMIANYPALQELEITSCYYRLIELAHLPALKYVWFYFMATREIFFYDLPNLEELNINGCSLVLIRLPGVDDDPGAKGILENGVLQPIDRNMPPANTSIRELYLHLNEIKTLKLPQEMSGLERLFLGNCGLESVELPTELPEMVDLNDNRLSELHIQGAQPRLIYLYLRNNRLSELHIQGEQQLLKTLDLRHNRLIRLELPDSLPELEKLDLCYNPLPALPACQMPRLSSLDTVFTDIVSWKDLPVSHPETLKYLSVQLNASEEINEITVKFPNLEAFSPFIDRDVDLSLLFDRWGDYDDEYCCYKSSKMVYVPNLLYQADNERCGSIQLALKTLPGLKYVLDKTRFELRTDKCYADISRNKNRLTLKYHANECKNRPDDQFMLPSSFFRTEMVIKIEKDSGDYLTYHFDAYGNHPYYRRDSPDNYWYRHLYDPVTLEVLDGRLLLNFDGPVASRVRGRVEMDGRVFWAKNGTWHNNGFDEVSWPLPEGYECLGKTALVRGFYDENWVKTKKKHLVVEVYSEW